MEKHSAQEREIKGGAGGQREREREREIHVKIY